MAIASLFGSVLLVAMTFDRFYSIISILFNISNLFISDNKGWECVPYAKAGIYSRVFYWFDLLLQFVLSSVLLLSMNSVIIHKLRTRSIVTQNQGRESDTPQRKHAETQIFIMLLLVTFGFLNLVTPAYAFFLYVILVDFLASPKSLCRVLPISQCCTDRSF